MKEQQIPLTEMRIAALDMKERLPLIMEFNAMDAKLKRGKKFLSLVKEGFTEDQALELVK